MYGRRNKILDQDDVHVEIEKAFLSVVRHIVEKYDFETDSSLALTELANEASAASGQKIHFDNLTSLDTESIILNLEKQFLAPVIALREKVGEENYLRFEKQLLLGSIDELWMNHIDRMAHLREEVAFE